MKIVPAIIAAVQFLEFIGSAADLDYDVTWIGKCLIFVEENYKAKSLIYRWKP